MSKVTLSHVYVTRGVVAAWVETTGGIVHRVGHLPWQSWFCTCKRGKRCAQIKAVQALVPVQAVETGGRNVEAGTASAPACAPAREAQHGWTDDQVRAVVRKANEHPILNAHEPAWLVGAIGYWARADDHDDHRRIVAIRELLIIRDEAINAATWEPPGDEDV